MKHIQVINISQTTKLFIKKWQLEEEEVEERRGEAETLKISFVKQTQLAEVWVPC